MSSHPLLSGSRQAMAPLFEQLLSQSFSDSQSAVEFCRQTCAEYGFTVKQEASANRNIYVYCSREGLPDSQRKPKTTPQRKRPSKRCDCRWRVVLSENTQRQWEFRKSSSPAASEHNHEMMDPSEMVKSWPSQVNDFIIHLARQRLQTHEIRECVKKQFPDIAWNERRFYNRLTEERKRMRQRDVLYRVQRLVSLSSNLCAMVAAHDEWFVTVETELTRLVESYSQLTHIGPDALPSLLDIPLDQISLDMSPTTPMIKSPPVDDECLSMVMDNTPSQPHLAHSPPPPSTPSSLKKRKSALLDMSPSSSSSTTAHADSPPTSSSQPHSFMNATRPPKGSYSVSIPPFTLYVRSHPSRNGSLSAASSSSTPSAVHPDPPPMHPHQRPTYPVFAHPQEYAMDMTPSPNSIHPPPMAWPPFSPIHPPSPLPTPTLFTPSTPTPATTTIGLGDLLRPSVHAPTVIHVFHRLSHQSTPASPNQPAHPQRSHPPPSLPSHPPSYPTASPFLQQSMTMYAMSPTPQDESRHPPPTNPPLPPPPQRMDAQPHHTQQDMSFSFDSVAFDVRPPGPATNTVPMPQPATTSPQPKQEDLYHSMMDLSSPTHHPPHPQPSPAQHSAHPSSQTFLYSPQHTPATGPFSPTSAIPANTSDRQAHRHPPTTMVHSMMLDQPPLA
ncbi:hypothetical protein DM01DRAFT_1407181 [Hesseltinella vesiculosa]|uniref:FAR1 domain-containing protein n=1 Tax=Hesseltinella vesiculosa TaxID=101127 RepID=A0A1X2GJG9_9FUNG|nr:hypothetical protein DM01DRAFT_1407181 [Hesseltinella vesiculosa]